MQLSQMWFFQYEAGPGLQASCNNFYSCAQESALNHPFLLPLKQALPFPPSLQTTEVLSAVPQLSYSGHGYPRDTAVAVNPEDERYQDIIGKMLKLPLTDREIPVVAAYSGHGYPHYGCGEQP